jgi:hypothetical protein
MGETDPCRCRFDAGFGRSTRVQIEGVSLQALYTPGHTDDSYSYLMGDRVFTGDTLLIRGTGRTDFQNGNPHAQYDSIFNKLLKLPEDTLVYPAHDYKGDMVSTIGEEKRFNPRLSVKSVDEYVDLMNNLKLPNPKMMDIAVPANMQVGLHQEEIARKGWAVKATEALALRSRPDVALVDLREKNEREKHGSIPGALHAPYTDLQENIGPGGMLQELAATTGNVSCSIALSASAPPWRYRPPKMPASGLPATLRGALTPGKRQADRLCVDHAIRICSSAPPAPR